MIIETRKDRVKVHVNDVNYNHYSRPRALDPFGSLAQRGLWDENVQT